VAGAICLPVNCTDSSNQPNLTSGQNTEVPQFQGKVAYERDLWGKAAFYGVPRGFTAQITGGWQRMRFRNWTVNQAVSIFGPSNYLNLPNARQRAQQYLDPWILQLDLFIPLLTTKNKALAGTASLQAQAYVGQGLQAFGEAVAEDSSLLQFQSFNPAANVNFYDRQLISRYGGYLQGQYWFTNQWYLNVVYSFSKAYGVSTVPGEMATPMTATPSGVTTNNNDPTKFWQSANVTLWFIPIQALKFGLQYSYVRTAYFQKVTEGSRVSDFGGNHRLMFAGFFYF
jgi:hypothetical protein